MIQKNRQYMNKIEDTTTNLAYSRTLQFTAILGHFFLHALMQKPTHASHSSSPGSAAHINFRVCWCQSLVGIEAVLTFYHDVVIAKRAV